MGIGSGMALWIPEASGNLCFGSDVLGPLWFQSKSKN